MAAIIKRGKVWCVKYYDAFGHQKWVRGYKDKRETEALAARLEDAVRKVKNGDVDPQLEERKRERARPIAEHVEDYRAALTAPGNSGNHVAYTCADILAFVAFSGVRTAAEATRTQVDRWVNKLTAAKKDSPSTINRRVGSVKAFLKWLHGRGVLGEYVLHRYPKLKTLGTERRRRRALTPTEQKKLIAAAPESRRDIYTFALLTGARHVQIQTLRAEAVNLKERTVTLRAKDNRHRNRVQVIPIHPDLMPILSTACRGKEGDSLVFPDLPDRFTAARLLREDCVAAGVDTKHVDFHGLRHSFITSLAAANVHPKIVQQLAGHANVETTLRHYTHFRSPDERAALALLAVR